MIKQLMSEDIKEYLIKDSNKILLDVRTQGEWDSFGRPDGEQLGLKTYFWKVAMRPGKPLMYGKIQNIPLLGLPGNPVSAIVCTFLFIIPIINKLLGKKNIINPSVANIFTRFFI